MCNVVNLGLVIYGGLGLMVAMWAGDVFTSRLRHRGVNLVDAEKQALPVTLGGVLIYGAILGAALWGAALICP